MKSFRSALILSALFISFHANAATPIRILPPLATSVNRSLDAKLSNTQLSNRLNALFGAEDFREIRARVIYNNAKPDHVLAYLFSKKFHHFEYASIKIDANANLDEVTRNYKLQNLDLNQPLSNRMDTPTCPDPTVQFISACPNDDDFEIGIANDVANAAKAKGLNTVVLLKKDLTSKNYLNYMSCPNLIGNFYDGDANTDVLATYDGEISANQFTTLLAGQFRNKVTNIWLACQAYNDPMLTAVRDTDQSQKYAAGINDLLVGPSDDAAACTMKAGLEGKPLTQSFEECKKKFDTDEDQWGFGGNGSDFLGQ